MDWPKAKSILIIGFLLVDLCLSWLLFTESRVVVANQLTAEDVQGLVALSRYYGVELTSGPLPLQVGKMPILNLLEQIDSVAIAEAAAAVWLGGDATITESIAGSFVFRLGDQQLRAIPGRYLMDLSLQLAQATATTEPVDRAACISLANDFLRSHLSPGEAALYQSGLVTVDQQSGICMIEFNRVEHGLPSFLNYYRFQVSGGRVIGLQARQSQLDGDAGRKQQLVAAGQPLKRYLAQIGMQEEPLTIHDLRLGFGLLPGEVSTLQPVWRLVTSQPGQKQTEVFFPAELRYWGAENR